MGLARKLASLASGVLVILESVAPSCDLQLCVWLILVKVLFAKMLGADEVVGISRTSAKKEDVMKMGATGFIATDEDKDWATKHAKSLDLIVSTVSSPNMPIAEYLQLLRFRGVFIQVGAPE